MSEKQNCKKMNLIKTWLQRLMIFVALLSAGSLQAQGTIPADLASGAVSGINSSLAATGVVFVAALSVLAAFMVYRIVRRIFR